MVEEVQLKEKPPRFPHANRAYHPEGYDLWWGQGRSAAVEGKPRQQPFLFAYSYEASCWLDGYDNVRCENTKRLYEKVMLPERSA